MRMFLALYLLCLALAAPVHAAPARYALDPGASSVTFSYVLAGAEGQGTMPITRADLLLDFDAAARSTAQVTLDASGVEAANGLITAALKSNDVLATDAHPDITFVSRQITAADGGATLVGDVTVRGVTRPLTLKAQIFRAAGSAAGDLSRLTVRLTGAINRHDFGASGYSGLVDDTVGIDITARLVRRD
jgi:polyisoprenoid-binding protein YceI